MRKNSQIEEIKKQASQDELELYSYVVDNALKISQEIYNSTENVPIDVGGMVFIYGPVNSGKSIIACKLLEMYGQNASKRGTAICAQPEVDRPDLVSGEIYSRGGVRCEAMGFSTKSEIEDIFHSNGVVIIDEIQFIPYELQSFFLKEVEQFIERGGWAILLGLRYTSIKTEFLLSAVFNDRAKKVYSLTSTCLMCGRKGARWNQRLIDGKSANYTDPDLEPPSGKVTYEPRCDDCII